jgi:hypothetical protein
MKALKTSALLFTAALLMSGATHAQETLKIVCVPKTPFRLIG